MKNLHRRDFMKLGVAGIAGAAFSNVLAQPGVSSVTGVLASRTIDNFDFILAATGIKDNQEYDLGGVIKRGLSLNTLSAESLRWQHDVSLPLFNGKNAAGLAASPVKSRFTLETTVGESGSKVKFSKLLVESLQDSQAKIVVPLDKERTIPSELDVFSFERNFDDVSYHLLGVLGKNRGGEDSVIFQPAQYRQGPLFFDSGWRSLPRGYEFRIKGPELHPLRPCRDQDTWHYNFEIKQNGRWIANHHFGAYKEGRGVCLLYYESRNQVCKRLCSPRIPTWGEVYNFAYSSVDSTFRNMGVVLPYFAVAAVALIFTSLAFAGLLVAAV
jgi:hypothetical protein